MLFKTFCSFTKLTNVRGAKYAMMNRLRKRKYTKYIARMVVEMMYGTDMENIHKLNEKLAAEVERSNGNLTDPKVVALSQQMDEIVIRIQRQWTSPNMQLCRKTGS